MSATRENKSLTVIEAVISGGGLAMMAGLGYIG